MTDVRAWFSGRFAAALPLLGTCLQSTDLRCDCLRAMEGLAAPPFGGRFPVPAAPVSPNGGSRSEPDVAVAGFDQTALIRERHHLGAIGEAEFGEDAGDV